MAATQRKMGPYFIGPTLGAGGFSKVKLGIHESTGDKVALKCLKDQEMSESTKKQVAAELNAMAKVKHENVIMFHSVDWAALYPKKKGPPHKIILVILELATGGELFEFLSFTGCFEEPVARTYFRQLVDGIAYCHSQGIAHRDLKPENLLLDHQFVLKIADFGFSQQRQEGSRMMTECGTPAYMAPEMFNTRQGNGYDAARTDIWACGVVLFIMLAGFPPFQKPNISDWWFHKLKNNRHDLFWRAHSRTVSFSDTAKDLLNKMLCPDETQRITMEDIKRHAFFQGSVLSKDELLRQFNSRKSTVDAAKVREKMQKTAKENGTVDTSAPMEGITATDRGDGDDFPDLPPAMEFYSHAVGKAAPAACADDNDTYDEEKVSGTAEAYDVARAAACYTRFESAEAPDELYMQLVSVFKSLNAKYSTKDASFKVKGTMSTANGPVTMAAQIFKDPSAPVYHVEFKRLNGDGMQFRSLYWTIREQFEPVIVKNPVRAESKE